jgi:diaminopimelate epimerase
MRIGEHSMVSFFKYHGLGNDFVLLDARAGGRIIAPEQARRMCDRHLGIGADGVLTVLPSERAKARMHIYNADGSEARMCGNGVRCFVKHLVDQQLASESEEIRVETAERVVKCRAHQGGLSTRRGVEVESVTVDMGPVSFARRDVPMVGEGEFVQQKIEAEGTSFLGTALSVGNPHLVIFGGAEVRLASRFGPALEGHPWFPDRTNVGFARVVDPETLELVVYERGVGVTLACGSGACAAAAAARRLRLVASDRETRVVLPGGALFVWMPPDFSTVWMRGPAALAFRGDWPDE